MTVGVEFGSRTIDVAGRQVKLQCWDTAGQDRFRSIVRCYYRGTAGALLVYDITRRASFEHISQWVTEAKAHADPDLVITLVGNKQDRSHEREVAYEEGHGFAQRNGLYFLETSAVTGHMVEEAFMVTAKLVYQKQHIQPSPDGDEHGGYGGIAPGSYASQGEYLGNGVSSEQRPSTLKIVPDQGRLAYGQQHQNSADSCCG